MLPEDLASMMKQIAGFRNVLVHEYLGLDPKIVCKSLKKIDDFKKFVKYVLT